jgi:uncharacterized coiled-coil DUF342 family protein
MRTPQAIIQELKHQLNWSQPNIRFTELSNLINELEATLNTQPTTKKPEPVVVEAVVEEPVVEVTEEVVEVKATRKTTKK